MGEKWIRVYRKFNPQAIKANLLVYGDLTGSCENCSHMDVKLDAAICPACKTGFRYIAFRNIKTHFPKIEKLMEANPAVIIIDYDDYKRTVGASKAEDFLR